MNYDLELWNSVHPEWQDETSGLPPSDWKQERRTWGGGWWGARDRPRGSRTVNTPSTAVAVAPTRCKQPIAVVAGKSGTQQPFLARAKQAHGRNVVELPTEVGGLKGKAEI